MSTEPACFSMQSLLQHFFSNVGINLVTTFSTLLFHLSYKSITTLFTYQLFDEHLCSLCCSKIMTRHLLYEPCTTFSSSKKTFVPSTRPITILFEVFHVAIVLSTSPDTLVFSSFRNIHEGLIHELHSGFNLWMSSKDSSTILSVLHSVTDRLEQFDFFVSQPGVLLPTCESFRSNTSSQHNLL